MKTDFLKGLGLTEEQITSIMAENGKDIGKEQTKAQQATEKLQTELENSKLEIKSRDEQLANVNSEIEKFKTMDVDSIKNKVTELEGKNKEYETQLTTSKEAYEKQLAEKDYEFSVKEIVGQHKFESEWAKEQFTNTLKSKGFKLEEGKLLGADDYIKDFSEKNKGIFVVEAPTNETKLPEFTTQNTNQTQPKKGMSLTEAMKKANAGEKVDFSQLEI